MSELDVTAEGASPRESRLAKTRRLLADFGPGFVLAATGIGVGDMVSATIAGAEYGLTLIWALAVGVVLKFAITEGLARWQLATDTTLIEGWRDHLHPFVLATFGVYFVVWTYVVSSAMVAASAMVPSALIPVVPQPAWGLIHALAAFALVFWGTYERFVKIMKFFIGLMFGSVLLTNLLIVARGVDTSRFGSHADLSLAYTLALIGGVGGTVTMLSYGYWIREQRWHGPGRLSGVRADLASSYSLVFFFALSMMFLSTQIEWQGQILQEGPNLCLLLADRIGAEMGQLGRFVFLMGFWGAASASLLGVWNGVPYLFDDWIHLWRRQQPKGPTGSAYKGYLVYMTLAALSTVFLQRPVWLIFVYTVIGSLFFPFVIATLLWMNTRSSLITEKLRNRAAVNVILTLALLLYVYLGIRELLT
jgi:Mn2+/Fe2+ NRAMP family transporter